MVQQTIDVGTIANDGTGDPLRAAGIKINQNFDEVFAGVESVVFVRSESDFPTPSGGISDLGAKAYWIVSTTEIDISFRLRQTDPRGIIIGLGSVTSSLNFTNTSAVDANYINTLGTGVSIENLILNSPNAPLFDCNGNSVARFSLKDVVLANMTDIGKLDSFLTTLIDSPLIAASVTGGLQILGNSFNVDLMRVGSQTNNTTPTFDLSDSGLVVQNILIDDCTAPLLTGTNKFADIDPTKTVNGLVVNSTFTGTDPLGSAIDNTTSNFNISGGSGVVNTRKIGEIDLDSPITVPIVTQGLPVAVAGTWSGNALSQFQVNGAGIQYIGQDSTEVFRIEVTINGTRPGGTGSDTYQGRILLDGSVVGFPTPAEISDKGGSIIIHTFTSIDNLDTITIDVSNESATTDLDIVSSNIEVNRVN